MEKPKMGVIPRIIDYIVKTAMIPVLSVTLLFDIVTLFKYQKTKGLFNFIFSSKPN